MNTYDYLIIGAGSVGTPLAYYLSKKGAKVGVIEELASNGRGQNRAAIGGIRATHSDPAKIKICQESIDILKNFEIEHGKDVDWIDGGYLYVSYDESSEKMFKDLLVKQKELKLNIDWISAEEVIKLAPGINPEGLRGGTFSPEDGSASPIKVSGAYYYLARNAGATFHFKEKVIGFELNGNKISKVKTDKNEYSANVIINAAGAYARELGALLNLDLPVFPDSHEAGISEPVKRFFEPMIVDIRSTEDSDNYYFYQNVEGQIVFCITPRPKIMGENIDNTSVFLPQCVKRMVELYPRLRNLKVRRTWRGLYPTTPDGSPIIGWTKKISNLFLTVGMCGQGFMLGPGLGKIVSEILIDKTDRYNFILDQLTLYREFSGTEMLK